MFTPMENHNTQTPKTLNMNDTVNDKTKTTKPYHEQVNELNLM